MPRPATVGGLTRDADGVWTWTDEVYQILGFRVGEVPATAALLLTHVHPDSRDLAARLLDPDRRGLVGGSLTLVAAKGQQRAVVLTGRACDQDLTLQMVDVTDENARRSAHSRAEAVAGAIAARSPIDQAIGAVRLVYGVAEPEAFSVLSWASQRSGVKLRLLAERLTERLATSGSLMPEQRRDLDAIAFAAMEDRPPEPPALRPRVQSARESVPGLSLVAITGELDLCAAPLFTAELVAAVAELAPHDVLVVDLTRAEHVGTVALSVLEGLTRRCARQQVALRVVLPDLPGAGTDGLRRAGASVHRALGDALSG